VTCFGTGWRDKQLHDNLVCTPRDRPPLCRRKQREAKKYGKQVMAEVRKERAASKRANVDSMTKLRKQREKRCTAFREPCTSAPLSPPRGVDPAIVNFTAGLLAWSNACLSLDRQECLDPRTVCTLHRESLHDSVKTAS